MPVIMICLFVYLDLIPLHLQPNIHNFQLAANTVPYSFVLVMMDDCQIVCYFVVFKKVIWGVFRHLWV